MEDVEYQLVLIDNDGKNQKQLGPIMMAMSAIRLTEVRSFIEENELLDFEFKFWNNIVNLCYDRKFEKVNKVRGLEIIVVKDVVAKVVEECIPKRPRLEGEAEHHGFSSDNDMETLPEGATENESTEVATPVTKDRDVPPESGGPTRLRSTILKDDVKECWMRAVRSCEAKMAKVGHQDHKWWFETWDEGEHPVAKLWCHECKKWQGNGKVDQYSNTCSNFMRQHVPTTLHMKEYHRRVGKEAVMLEQARQLAGQDQPNDKQLIDEAVGIIKAANDKGDECFVIQGDLTNLRLSPAAYKWQCKYCRVLHNICPRTNNLAWSLELHLNGDRHIQKRAEAEKMLAGHQPFSSGRVGRPLWQVSVADDEKQQRIKSFFHPTPSSASNTAGSSGVSSSSKGTYNALLVCWGLWRSQAIVEGRKIHIKPFLLDQQRGSNWYSEPFLAAEIEYNDRTLLVDGCFRHVACMRISTDSDGFQDFTCDKCHSIIQEKDFKMRVFREEEAAIKRGDRDTGRGRRIDFLQTDEAKLLIKQKNAKARRLERELWVLRARLLRQKTSQKSFIMVQELANREDITNFCRRIVSSWRDGLWGGKEALWDFMSDVSKNLSRKANGRRYSKNTKVMWEVVKLRAGPVISNFLTRNLQGPSLSTTKRDIKKEFHYVAGESAVQFRHIGKTYGKLKEQGSQDQYHLLLLRMKHQFVR
ncbi:unnamed protein product [Calypogeia fissa]